jgi:hypothetical protein
VSTPWSVELEQHILVAVNDDFLVVLGDDDGGGAFLLLGDRLALDAGLELAGNKVGDELGQLLGGESRGITSFGVWELLVLDGVLDGESGPRADLKVEVASVLTESGRVNGSEVDLALVLLGEGLDLSGKAGALLFGLGEDVGEGDLGL